VVLVSILNCKHCHIQLENKCPVDEDSDHTRPTTLPQWKFNTKRVGLYEVILYYTLHGVPGVLYVSTKHVGKNLGRRVEGLSCIVGFR
jgi:hypothetical protein